MIETHRSRRREKLSATVDADLLETVDRFVADHPEQTRSSVIDAALRLWSAEERAQAIAKQYDGDNGVPPDEWASWRSIRDAAAEVLLTKPR